MWVCSKKIKIKIIFVARVTFNLNLKMEFKNRRNLKKQKYLFDDSYFLLLEN